MGKYDAESKKYLSVNQIFADAFNYIIYDGEPVIKPETLKPVDTTEIATPYGNGAVADLKLVYTEPEEEGGVDMCKAMEDYTKKIRVSTVIDVMKSENRSSEEIIKKVSDLYQVSREYVEELLEPVAI